MQGTNKVAVFVVVNFKFTFVDNIKAYVIVIIYSEVGV